MCTRMAGRRCQRTIWTICTTIATPRNKIIGLCLRCFIAQINRNSTSGPVITSPYGAYACPEEISPSIRVVFSKNPKRKIIVFSLGLRDHGRDLQGRRGPGSRDRRQRSPLWVWCLRALNSDAIIGDNGWFLLEIVCILWFRLAPGPHFRSGWFMALATSYV